VRAPGPLSTETLWAYAKGELSLEQAAAVKAALEGSAQARAELEQVEASLAVLALVPQPPPMPDAMARRIGRALADQADEATARSLTSWWKAFVTPRAAFALAGACAVALVMFLVSRGPPVPAGDGVAVGPLANVTAPELTPVPVTPPPNAGGPAKGVKATVASAKNAKSRGAALARAQVLEAGSSVSTEKGGSLWLQLPDGTKAGLTGATAVGLVTLNDRALALEVTRGSLAMVVPHREERVLTVRAGEVEVKDLGTRFLVSKEQLKVVVAVEEGSVEVKTPTSTRVVTAGHVVTWRDGALVELPWPSPVEPRAPVVSSPQPVAEAPLTPPVTPEPSSETAAEEEEVDAEPASAAIEEEWAQLPAGQPEPPPTVDGTQPPAVVVTVQPPGAPRVNPLRRNRRNSGFSLRAVEQNLRELERQVRNAFPPLTADARAAAAKAIARLADAQDCEAALDAADVWLRTPASEDEAGLRRTVLQQKVRCLNHLGRAAEALEVQRLLVP